MPIFKLARAAVSKFQEGREEKVILKDLKNILGDLSDEVRILQSQTNRRHKKQPVSKDKRKKNIELH